MAAGGWNGQAAGWVAGGGAWPAGAAAAPWVAAAVQVENTDEVEELELEQKANNQRMDEWVRPQSQIHLSTDERCDLLPAMALQFTQGNGMDTNDLLLGCIINSEPVPRLSVRPFGNVG